MKIETEEFDMIKYESENNKRKILIILMIIIGMLMFSQYVANVSLKEENEALIEQVSRMREERNDYYVRYLNKSNEVIVLEKYINDNCLENK